MNANITEHQIAEVTPADVDMDPDRLRRARELVRRRGSTAQLSVTRYGQLVDYSCYGCSPDALFWLFSTSKPYVTVLVHQLAEAGWFSLDDPVARHWPEFGRHGKDQITINHVLQHRTGFATTGTPLRDMLACTHWDRMIRSIERVRPRRPAGSSPTYQFLIFGFILGELIQRATGRRFAEVLQSELLMPLGVHDTYVGIGPGQSARAVPLVFRHPGGAFAAGRLNLESSRAAPIPSAGISATAPDVAALFEMILAAGRAGDRQLITAESIAHATTVTTNGEVDRMLRSAVPWSSGFQLGGSRGPGRVPPFGYRSTRRTFGHNGSNCCLAWGDPDRDLVLVYLSNLRTGVKEDMAHLAAVSDLVLDACVA